jgi:hypothetical protein
MYGIPTILPTYSRVAVPFEAQASPGLCSPLLLLQLLHLLQLGLHVDSGRAISWRLLLYTRAIVPARVTAGLWPKAVSLRWGGRSVLLLAALLIAGVAVRLGQRDPTLRSSVVSPPPTSASVSPAPRAQRW